MILPALIAVIVLFAVVMAAWVRARRRPAAAAQPVTSPSGTGRRILFPFMAQTLSIRALDAALRLARVEQATVVAVYLARVSLDLPLDAPIALQAGIALSLQEAIEQRAAGFDVPVEVRIERGRSDRHALRLAVARERFDRIVVVAACADQPGLRPEDVSWLLDHAPGEIIVLRPGPAEGAPHRMSSVHASTAISTPLT
jgi:nucleotide-binding universal stress UspA family protein